MPRLSLDNLTVMGATPAEIVQIAEAIGVETISPIALPSARVALDIRPLVRGSPHVGALRDALQDSPVHIHNMDGFIIRADLDWPVFWDTLELSAELGAQNIVTLQFDPDFSRGLDGFCALSERAAGLGMGVVLEFMPLSQVKTIADADTYLIRAGQDNSGIMVDFFHLMQSGGGPADVASIDSKRIWCAQFCDGPLPMSEADYAYRAVNDRCLPGDGNFPLAEIVEALPEHATIGVEIPMTFAGEEELSPLLKAGIVFDATRQWLAKYANHES